MKRIFFIMLLIAALVTPSLGQATSWNIYSRPNANWFSGSPGRDIPWEWMKDIDNLVAGGLGSMVDTGGEIYYVDNNKGDDGYDGLSWDHAFLTIATALEASHDNIAESGEGRAANRNRIYVKGDDFDEDLTDLAQKTDVIGVGSDDGNKMPRLLGNHTIDAVASGYNYMGCRFINMTFLNQAGTALITIPTGHNGIEFVRCKFECHGSTGCTTGILSTANNDLKIIGCDFVNSGTGFTTAAISIGAGASNRNFIVGNWIDAEVGILVDIGTTAVGSVIRGNTIYATTFTIDENTDDFFIMNNALITATTIAGGTDIDPTMCVGNIITGSDGTKLVPLDASVTALTTAVNNLSGLGFYGTITDVGATTLMETTDLAGFGDDFFNVDYVAICIQAEGATPEGEIRNITDYTSIGGVFAVAAWGAALEVGDEVFVGRREDFAIDGVTLIAAPATGSLATFIAGTGSLGTALGSGTSLVDALGSDGVALTDGTVSVAAIIGVPTDADHDVVSTSVSANADGSVYERLEQIDVDTSAILDDTGSSGVALGTDVITATVIQANAIGAAEIADGAIDAGAIASDAITTAEIATGAIGADEVGSGAIDADAIAADAITSAEIANDAIGPTEVATDTIDADALAADALTEIQASVTSAIVDDSLDHLTSTVLGDTSDPVDMSNELGDDTFLANIITDDGDVTDYDRRLHSLEAIANINQTIMARILRSMGGVSAGTHIPIEFWWVDGNATNDTGDGKTPGTAKKTLTAVLTECGDTQDDWVFIRDYSGSTNEITVANAFVHIVGYGNPGMPYPRLQASTSGEAGLCIGPEADRLELFNLFFASTDAAGGIEFTGSGGSYDVWIHGCRFGRSGNTCQDGIEVMSGSNAPYLVVENCEFGGHEDSSLTRDGIRFSGNCTGAIIRNNTFRNLAGIGLNFVSTMESVTVTGNIFALAADGVGDAVDLSSGSARCLMANNVAEYGIGAAVEEVFLDRGTGNEWANNIGGSGPGSTSCAKSYTNWTAAAHSLFNVKGGPVVITRLVGIVTATIRTTPMNIQLNHTTTAPGVGVALASNVDTSADAIGTSYTLNDTLGGALVVTANGVLEDKGDPFVAPVGTLSFTSGAIENTGGTVIWYVYYDALAPGAYVVPATTD